MHRIVEQLAAKGIRTVVVHPVPKYPGWDLRGCAAGHVVIDEFACGRSMTRGTAEAQSSDLDRSEDAAVAGIPRAETVGFIPQVCTPTACCDRPGRHLALHRRRPPQRDRAPSGSPAASHASCTARSPA